MATQQAADVGLFCSTWYYNNPGEMLQWKHLYLLLLVYVYQDIFSFFQMNTDQKRYFYTI